jgi:UDP-N-acetylmuramate dehydrogenase
MGFSKDLQNFIACNPSFKKDYYLHKLNWFNVGGKADYLFKPQNEDELISFLKLAKDVPIEVIGVGSNVIIRDGGFRGVVIKLGKEFKKINLLDKNKIEVGCANLDINVANFAYESNISGLEFLSGIPGSIGGAVAMNAGAYGSEFKDVLFSVSGIDFSGRKLELSNAAMNYSYRCSNPEKNLIYTSVILQGVSGKKDEIARNMAKIKSDREVSQPVRAKTSGSSFKNPKGMKAWELIDQAGCRGLEIGGAKMSEKHCNFMINTGNATAKDLEDLGKEVVNKVWQKFFVKLEWEVKIIGDNL